MGKQSLCKQEQQLHARLKPLPPPWVVWLKIWGNGRWGIKKPCPISSSQTKLLRIEVGWGKGRKVGRRSLDISFEAIQGPGEVQRWPSFPLFCSPIAFSGCFSCSWRCLNKHKLFVLGHFQPLCLTSDKPCEIYWPRVVYSKGANSLQPPLTSAKVMLNSLSVDQPLSQPTWGLRHL